MSYEAPNIQAVLSSSNVSNDTYTTTVIRTERSKLVEYWIEVESGTGDLSFHLQSSLDEDYTDASTKWATVKSKVNVTAAGTYVVHAFRETEALGNFSRLYIQRNSGSLTITVRSFVREV